MQKDPYLILGLTNEATRDEVENAYQTLKAKYSRLRFEEGEVGSSASKMLGQLEIAYASCMEDLRSKDVINNYGNNYGEIERLIEQKQTEQAQELLDKCEVRDAEWHYMQARIYYTRQWHSEAKKQLEIACDLDPANDKYKTTLKRLERVLNGSSSTNSTNNSDTQDFNHAKQRAGYSQPNSSSKSGVDNDACCNACSTLICADCCCECMGGDLIPCC